MKTKNNAGYNILRIIFLSLSAILLLSFCLVVMKISHAATEGMDLNPRAGKTEANPLSGAHENVPLPVVGYNSTVDEMLNTPGYWIKVIDSNIKEENNAADSPKTASVESITKDHNYWVKEIKHFIQMEETNHPQTILRDI